jgi:hypothetical protein
MLSLKKILAAGAVTVGLLSFQMSPATAAGAGVGVFTGTANIGTSSTGFGYPIGQTPNCDALETGLPVGVCEGEVGTWSLTASGAGLGVESSDPDAAAVGLLDITGTGTASSVLDGRLDSTTTGIDPDLKIGAWCGLSGGHHDGTGSVTVNALVPTPGQAASTAGADGKIVTTYDGVGWFSSAATVIVFENLLTRNGNTPIVAGVVSAIPPAPVVSTASCLNKTARTFTVVGASAIVNTAV